MLSLTVTQQQKIRALNEDSFREYCETCGYHADEHAGDLLRIGKEQLEQALGGIKIEDVPNDERRSAISKMRSATDYFEFRTVEHERRRRAICATLTQFAPKLPITYDYVARLCQRLGLAEPSPTKPGSIAELIESVPIVSNWDFQFNASVASLVDYIPCICISELLLTTCDSFLHRVAPLAIEFKEKARPAKIEDCAAMGQRPDFMDELYGCISMAMGKSNFVKRGAVETDQKTYSTVHVMVEASVQAVWYHEFGHLLQGHLEQLRSHQLEFEADCFAFQVLSQESRNKSLDVWLGLGGLAPLVIIDIIETISQSPESESHPSGRRRIGEALNVFKRVNPRLVQPAVDYLRSLAAVCAPTLDKHWGVSLDYYYLSEQDRGRIFQNDKYGYR